MKKIEYIYENEQGFTCFDKYFEYLKTIQKELPTNLAQYALDPENYVLNGPNTLHDAWVKSFSINHNYIHNQSVTTNVVLKLLLGHHEAIMALSYFEVKSIVVPKELPLKPVDLLYHEFKILRPGVYSHLMIFNDNSYYEVIFKYFDFEKIYI